MCLLMMSIWMHLMCGYKILKQTTGKRKCKKADYSDDDDLNGRKKVKKYSRFLAAGAFNSCIGVANLFPSSNSALICYTAIYS